MTHSGGKPHDNVGDRGQRWEFRYYDENGEIQVFGWGNEREPMLKAMRGVPWVNRPFALDRQSTQVRDQCIAKKIPFFFKQWGGKTAKTGGKILDGREWCDYPREHSNNP